MSNDQKKLSMQELMKQALEKKKNGGRGAGTKTGGPVTQTGKMSSQLPKKPSMKGRRTGV